MGMLYPELAFWDAVHTVNRDENERRDPVVRGRKSRRVKFAFTCRRYFKIKQQKETKEKYDGIFSQTFVKDYEAVENLRSALHMECWRVWWDCL